MHKTKIVIDARESGTSTGRYIDKLIEYLHALKPVYEIIVLTKPERVSFFSEIAPDFVTIETPFKEFTFSEQLGFKKHIEDLDPDLVHFGMTQQPVLYRGRVVTTMHDLTTVRFRNPAKNQLVYVLKQRVYKWVNKKVAHKSRIIITPSQYVKNDVVNFAKIKPDKVVVTYEAADPISDKPNSIPKLEKKSFIMYVGRPTPHKNLEKLVDAFIELQEDNPSLYLVLAGKKDINYQRIEESITQRNIKNVYFTDFVSEGQLRWLYENCKAYVFPSLSEGFGLPGLEAMCHGAPVVSSNATCLPEIYGDAAAYFDPTDSHKIAVAINNVLTDTKLRAKLIQLGYNQVKTFSWEQMAKQTLNIYKTIVG